MEQSNERRSANGSNLHIAIDQLFFRLAYPYWIVDGKADDLITYTRSSSFSTWLSTGQIIPMTAAFVFYDSSEILSLRIGWYEQITEIGS